MAFNDLFGGFRPQYHLWSKYAHVSGITKDAAGAALGSCVVKCFITATDVLFSQTTSDGSGNYTLTTPIGVAVYLVSYKAGTPDVAGTSVNTLVGV